MNSQDSERGIQEVPSTPFYLHPNTTVSQDSGIVPLLPSPQSVESPLVNNNSISVPEMLLSPSESTYHGIFFAVASPQVDQQVPFGSFESFISTYDQIPNVRTQPQHMLTSSPAQSRRSVEQQRRIQQMSNATSLKSNATGAILDEENIFG